MKVSIWVQRTYNWKRLSEKEKKKKKSTPFESIYKEFVREYSKYEKMDIQYQPGTDLDERICKEREKDLKKLE